jgi:hypothetical protein
VVAQQASPPVHPRVRGDDPKQRPWARTRRTVHPRVRGDDVGTARPARASNSTSGQRRRETILPVPYFHLVFTVPSELRLITSMNPERVFALMFQAASQTVLLLSRDKKRLGGTPALTMVLHTWTRQLTFHPHVHAS